MDLSSVARLPDDLVNKIAAGEVVERPASVVKELVENALDAGARQVLVEISGGGKTLVRVRDDGQGMGREDAELALERHATSKLRELVDLQQMLTHGFRGEALPSIASVSLLLLRTRDQSSAAGTEVLVRHGTLVHVRETGHPRGTTVEVRDLFGGVPARRKFLRADATEASHVAEALTLLALAHTGVSFALESGGRNTLQAPATDGLAARIYQIFGAEALAHLLPVEGQEGDVSVRGFVTRPDRPPRARAQLRLFVNGRAVRDRAVARALSQAFRGAGAGEPRGDSFLFLETPRHLVDVNVHPAKTEVRFAEPRGAWSAVEHSVRAALSAGVRGKAPRAPDPPPPHLADVGAERGRSPSADGAGLVADAPVARPPAGTGRIWQAESGQATAPAPPNVLGQHRSTYIVASDGEDLILVDQHTAHERVRFEDLLARLERRAIESQGLLLPVVVTLPPDLRPLLEQCLGDLGALGFDVEPFGGGSARLRAVPAALGTRDPGPALLALLRALLEREATDWEVSAQRDRLAATLACHSAVRAGQTLSVSAMSAIVNDLSRTLHPTLCPHGRPTSVRIPQGDVSRWFGRVGWKRR